MKTDRLLSITLFLINRKKATARELADHFEVSVRTIQRDMESLALAGIPIYADRGKEGGYKIMDNYSVDRHFFSPQELSALTSLIGRLNLLVQHSDLKKAEEKLRGLSGNQSKSRKHDALIMDFTPWGMEEKARDLFQTVHRAVESSQCIRIQYASIKGETTEREIEPVSIIIKGAAWYVYGYCRLRTDMRLFKITRIMTIKPLPVFFSPDNHPPYKDQMTDSADNRPRTLFVLKFSPSARGRVTDYYNSESLQFMPDGSIIGFFPFPEDEWVYSFILSFGPLVEVLEPPHAKKRIAEIVRSLATLYPNADPPDK